MTDRIRRKIVNIAGFQFEEPRELSDCLAAFREVLPRHQPQGFKGEIARLRGESYVRFLLTGSDVSAVAEVPYPVFAFCEERGHVYWLGCEMQFRSAQGEVAFANISLIFFKGPLGSADKTPILRAEWEAQVEGSSDPHAQPHWHVYLATATAPSRDRYYILNEVGEVIPFEDEENGETFPLPTPLEELVRFHLAMAARWSESSDNPPYDHPTTDGLPSWIRGCLSYTRAQLVYVSKKLEAANTPPTKWRP